MESGKIDVISEVFSTLRVRSELYFQANLHGRTAVLVPPEKRRIRFHLVLQGTCWVGTEGAAPTLMAEGDIVLIPNGAAQTLATEPGLPAPPLAQLLAGGLADGVLVVGDGPVRARLLCGFCQFDEGIEHPAIASLPHLIPLRLQDLGAEPWAAATLKLLALEANFNGQGATAILERLMEIVVIQATRRVAAAQDDRGMGFVAALAEPGLSRALLAMHRAPEQNWRVGDLAVCAGMSRARFADRFAVAVGVPPMEYLTGWRLMKARALLSDTRLGIDDIAERCGYSSLPSFSRRFKARFGVGPGGFRRTQRGGEE